MAVLPPVQEPPAPVRAPRRRRPLVAFLLIGALVVAVTAVLAVLESSRRPSTRQPATAVFDVPTLDVAPGAAAPPRPDVAAAGDLLARLSTRTDIPARTMRAYLGAEAAMAAEVPACKLTWATLAGVGRIESHHGRYRGTLIADDGTLTPPIIGVPLDGSPGVRAIRDTDRGRLDGDRQWDRAVGAMQFLPTTWGRWSARADGDGRTPDPQNVDDAALTAARYLCASGGDLGSGAGWWKAVLTYNSSVAYGRDVFSAADAYARVAAAL